MLNWNFTSARDVGGLVDEDCSRNGVCAIAYQRPMPTFSHMVRRDWRMPAATQPY
jgi:hypothetical protein